jgi:hypothetical protein
MTYQIWVGGFHIQGGGPEPAYLAGGAEADSFQEACDLFFKDNPSYNPTNRTLWGCGIYDNEADARKLFG